MQKEKPRGILRSSGPQAGPSRQRDSAVTFEPTLSDVSEENNPPSPTTKTSEESNPSPTTKTTKTTTTTSKRRHTGPERPPSTPTSDPSSAASSDSSPPASTTVASSSRVSAPGVAPMVPGTYHPDDSELEHEENLRPRSPSPSPPDGSQTPGYILTRLGLR